MIIFFYVLLLQDMLLKCVIEQMHLACDVKILSKKVLIAMTRNEMVILNL
jgi:hypothetical protein